MDEFCWDVALAVNETRLCLWQKDNGRMVWEKTAGDRSLYYGTMAAIVGMFSYSGYLVYGLIFPKREWK